MTTSSNPHERKKILAEEIDNVCERILQKENDEFIEIHTQLMLSIFLQEREKTCKIMKDHPYLLKQLKKHNGSQMMRELPFRFTIDDFSKIISVIDEIKSI